MTNPPVISLSDTQLVWVGFVLTLIAGLAIRDWATSLVKGLRFNFDKSFNQGDTVYIDGSRATIMSIGIQKTVFAIVDERGLVLRHVPNTKIENLKLERVVSEDVHQDTNEEKAQEIIDLIQDRQETIDSHQFSSISENAEAIKELKEK
jgi:hypothetical protein